MLKVCDIWLKEAATLTPSSTSPSKQMQWKTSAGGRSGYVCGAAGAYVCVAVCACALERVLVVVCTKEREREGEWVDLRNEEDDGEGQRWTFLNKNETKSTTSPYSATQFFSLKFRSFFGF